MSYHRYITDALVLGAQQSGETSRRITLLTRSCGLIVAHAQGVRLGRSRLRPHLRTHALSHVSLVRGRETWRLVGAFPKREGEGEGGIASPGVSALLARLAALIRRLVPHDAPVEQLFERVLETVHFLSEEELNADEQSLVEVVLVSRVLFVLGYLDASRQGIELAKQCGWNRNALSRPRAACAALTSAVNEALEASHL